MNPNGFGPRKETTSWMVFLGVIPFLIPRLSCTSKKSGSFFEAWPFWILFFPKEGETPSSCFFVRWKKVNPIVIDTCPIWGTPATVVFVVSLGFPLNHPFGFVVP